MFSPIQTLSFGTVRPEVHIIFRLLLVQRSKLLVLTSSLFSCPYHYLPGKSPSFVPISQWTNEESGELGTGVLSSAALARLQETALNDCTSL